MISNIILFREKSKIKLNPISGPDCSGNPFLVTELAEVTKKDCNEKQD